MKRCKDAVILILLSFVALLIYDKLHNQLFVQLHQQQQLQQQLQLQLQLPVDVEGQGRLTGTGPGPEQKLLDPETIIPPCPASQRVQAQKMELELQTEKKPKPPLFFIWLGSQEMQPIHKAAVASCQKWNDDSFDVRIIRDSHLIDATTANTTTNTNTTTLGLGFHLHSHFHLLDNVQKSDYLRAELLHTHGGIYLDTDVFCLRPLNHTLSLISGKAVGGGTPVLIKGRENVNNNMLGPFSPRSNFTKQWHDALWRTMDDQLLPLLQKCKANHPDGNGGINYPSKITPGPQLCGTRWGELIDFIKDDTIRAYHDGILIKTFVECTQGNTQLENCDLMHIGCAGTPKCSEHAQKRFPQLFPSNDAKASSSGNTITNGAPSTPTAPPIRNVTLLYGIFTTPNDFKRRELLRTTILTSVGPDILCPLYKHLQQIDVKAAQSSKCRIFYAFVVGAGGNNHPGEHLPNNTSPIALASANANESDVVHLNIRENMNDGKTPTWFKYAAQFVDAPYNIDFVAKGDSDTFLWMPHLLNFMNRDLTPAPPLPENDHRRMYGGWMVDSIICGNHWYCPLLKGKTYMSGQFYFLSSDLVRFLTSDRVDRSMAVPHEDFDLGMRVLSHPYPVKLMPLTGHRFWHHEAYLKYDERWMDFWKFTVRKRNGPEIQTDPTFWPGGQRQKTAIRRQVPGKQ